MTPDQRLPYDKTSPTYTTHSIMGQPEYECPKHGNIGSSTLTSTMPDRKMVLCLRCYMEKLVEIGVNEVVRVK